MRILDIRESYGLECSEFSYALIGDFTVAEGWNILNEIVGSVIVKRFGNPCIKFPANVDTAKTIGKFKLKTTSFIFEFDVKPSKMREFEKFERLWNVIGENRNLIESVGFIVEDMEEEGGWEEYLTPNSKFEMVRDQILDDYKQMVDYVDEEALDESFVYKVQVIGEGAFLTTFCDLEFIDEKRWIYYMGISKKIGGELSLFNFDFKISMDVDWNLKYYDKIEGVYTKVYVDWCSLVVEKKGEKVSVYTEGRTDLSGQEMEIAKAIAKVTRRKVI